MIKGHTIYSLAVMFIICLMFAFQSKNTFADDQTCEYDPDNPSLESARTSLEGLFYDCAFRELYELLKIDTLSKCDRADAYYWLGVTLDLALSDEAEKDDSVFSCFYRAQEICPGYKGTLEEDTSDLGKIYRAAKDSLMENEEWREQKRQNSLLSLCRDYDRSRKRLRTYRIAAGIGIVGSAAAALIFNSSADKAYDRYKAAIDPDEIESEWDSYKSKYNTRNIMLGAAIAFAITEAYLLIKKPVKPDIDCANLKAEMGAIDQSNGAFGLKLTLSFPGL